MVKDETTIQNSVKEKHLSKSCFSSISLTINLKEPITTQNFTVCTASQFYSL